MTTKTRGRMLVRLLDRPLPTAGTCSCFRRGVSWLPPIFSSSPDYNRNVVHATAARNGRIAKTLRQGVRHDRAQESWNNANRPCPRASTRINASEQNAAVENLQDHERSHGVSHPIIRLPKLITARRARQRGPAAMTPYAMV